MLEDAKTCALSGMTPTRGNASISSMSYIYYAWTYTMKMPEMKTWIYIDIYIDLDASVHLKTGIYYKVDAYMYTWTDKLSSLDARMAS
jgi:hypothetical protein